MRKPGILMMVFVMVLVTMPAGVVPAFAQNVGTQNTGKKLLDVERTLEKKKKESARQRARAMALKAEIKAINANLVAAAKRVQDQELQVAQLENDLADLKRRAAAKEGQLRERRQQFSGVVMALSRLARFPTEAIIAQPIPPEDTVRSAILLRAAVPAIEKRAQSLRLELASLAHVRDQVQGRRVALQTALAALKAEEDRITAMRMKKVALRAEAISKARAAKSAVLKLGKKAKSLRDLVFRLEARKKAAQKKEKRVKNKRALAKRTRKSNASKRLGQNTQNINTRPSVAQLKALSKIASISKARGRLPFPAIGRLVGLYGQALDGGLTRKGISIATRIGGQVISPFDGKIVFAGPFRGYGQLLIIDHGEGYHSLLAGLGRIDVSINQTVLAGEPVAIMSVKGGLEGGGQPILYVEFRRNNQPINPLPWLAARKGTPKG